LEKLQASIYGGYKRLSFFLSGRLSLGLASGKSTNIGVSGTVQLNKFQMNKNLTKGIDKLGDYDILYLKGPDSL